VLRPVVTKQVYWEKVSGGLDWGREEWRKEIPEQVLEDSFCGRKQGEEEKCLEDGENKPNVDIVPDEYLNTWLNETSKEKLATFLQIKNSQRKILKWKGIKTYLQNNGYEIISKREIIDGTKQRVDFIRLKI
jgi:hypothetical protein